MLVALTLVLLLIPASIWAVDCDRAGGEAAIPACRETLQSNPLDVDALIQYADILLDLNRPEEAVNLLETTYGRNPTDTTIRLKLSNARESAAKDVEDSGPNARTLQRLSALRCNTRTGQAALDACNVALQSQPHDVELLLAKGDAHMLLKQPVEAATAYGLALAQDTNNPIIQSKLKLADAEASRVEKQSALVQSMAQDQRSRQEAEEEQRRQSVLRDRQEAEKRRLELEQRENLAEAIKTLRLELETASVSLDDSAGNEQVINARDQLAENVVAGEAMLASTSVKDINDHAQLIRDNLRLYNQIRQEWDAEQRDIALRTPPEALRAIAQAYFAGDYVKVAQIAEPDRFSDRRHIIQAYLFRSAARFNTYWLTGAKDRDLLEKSRKDILEIKRLDDNYVPYIAAFSPRYIDFFRGS